MKIEKIKTFFICIGVFITGVFGFILRDLLQGKRNTANTIGDNDRQSAELTERVGREIEELGERSRESESDYTAAKQTITEIKKNQQILENNSNNSC